MNPRTTAIELAGPIPEIASLVHDLRNPLSAIHGSAEVLISSRLSELQVRRIARNLFGASVRMKELLDEVLTRYSGTERRVDPSDLRELVTSAVDKVALVAEAQSAKIIQNIPENLEIAVDRQRIERVLVNLFVNALDVMPVGGSIRISAIPERHSVLIKVRDTCPGIDPKIRDRLFQPFALQASWTASAWASLFQGRLCSITADRCGWNREARVHAWRFVCPSPGGWRRDQT